MPCLFHLALLAALGLLICSATNAKEGAAFVMPIPPLTDAGLIGDVTKYCYEQIVQGPDAQLNALDQRIAFGVASHRISRSGARWRCDKSHGCTDNAKGERGNDVLFVPTGCTCTSPRILFIHGGSWIMGSPETLSYDVLASKIAAASGAFVLSIDYPLAPIGNFSTVLAASMRALAWLAKHGPHDCRNDPSAAPPLFIFGDSSGGGSALSAALYLHQEGHRLPGLGSVEVHLAGLLLYSPWTNLVCDTPDYYYNAFSPIQQSPFSADGVRDHGPAYVGDIMFQAAPNLNREGFKENAQLYLGSKDERLLRDPIASGFYASDASISALPPVYFAVGGSESILGDSTILAQRIAATGVAVQLDIFQGMWHDFPKNSEGCGNVEGKQLWQGGMAINRTGMFVRGLIGACQRHWLPSLGWPPYTTIHYNVPSVEGGELAEKADLWCQASSAEHYSEMPRPDGRMMLVMSLCIVGLVLGTASTVYVVCRTCRGFNNFDSRPTVSTNPYTSLG